MFAYHLFEDAHRRVEVRENLVDDVAAMSNGAIGQGEAHVANALEAFGDGVEDLHGSETVKWWRGERERSTHVSGRVSLHDVAQRGEIGVEVTFTSRGRVHFIIEMQWNLQKIEQFIRVGDVLEEGFERREAIER